MHSGFPCYMATVLSLKMWVIPRGSMKSCLHLYMASRLERNLKTLILQYTRLTAHSSFSEFAGVSDPIRVATSTELTLSTEAGGCISI
jgi:hypothetical protein